MRKIKGFKLTLRPHEIKRRAKKSSIDLSAARLDDLALVQFLECAAKTLTPGVVFDTFSHPDPDQSVLAPMPGLAYSLILACLADAFAPLQATLTAKETAIPADLWVILEEHALDEAVSFASGLIADEAEKESCELSPLNPLTDPGALSTALRKLDGEAKLGVCLDGGKLRPSASLVVSQSWLTRSKAKGRR